MRNEGMIPVRTICLVLVCVVTVRENFAFALTIVAPSATFHSSTIPQDRAPDDDSNLPNQLPADDSELPAVVEVESNLSDVNQSVAANISSETPLGSFAVEPSLGYQRADSLCRFPDRLYTLMRLRI